MNTISGHYLPSLQALLMLHPTGPVKIGLSLIFAIYVLQRQPLCLVCWAMTSDCAASIEDTSLLLKSC